MTTSTTDKILTVMRQGAEAVQKTFTKVDDEWMPMLTLEGGEGDPVLVAFDMDAQRDVINQLAIMAREKKAHTAGMVVSAWMAPADSPEIVSGALRASQHPKRREVLLVHGLDGETILQERAEIIRFDHKPPELGPWERTEITENNVLQKLQEALR